MAGQQLYPENFAPNIVLPGQVQSFTFNRSLSQWQLINRFTPTLITSCDNLFEFINLNEAGYRFHHLTNISSQIGDFIFEKFNNGHIPGTPIFRIQESTGNFIFSLPSGGGLQLNNGTSVTPLQFYNSAGTHYAALQAGNLTSNVTWTLPLNDSMGIQAIVSNGSGALSFSSFADNLAKYIIQTADSGLPNAQVLASLSTGIVKNTTTTGVLSIALAGTDYYSPGHPTTLIDDFNLNGDPFNSYGNNAVGTLALNSLILNDSTNTYNVAVGSQALYQFTTGFANTALGMAPLFSLVSGNNNTVIGAFSAGFMTSGNQNCIVGSYPTFGNVVSGSDRNTVIGYAAAQNQTIYNSCVFLGANADASVNNLFNSIAIGDGALVGANNTCVIGQAGLAMNLIINGIAGTGAGTINAIWNGTPVGLAYGGTNANLTASNGSVVYSTSSALALTGAPLINHQILMSVVGSSPIWSDIVYPNSILPGQLLYGFGTTTIAGLSTAANGVLVTDSSNMPSISSTLPSAVQGNITSVGTIAAGTWNGNIIALQYGGTNANLTAAAGAIPYSTASALALLSPTTANKVFMSGTGTVPAWSSATYPVSTTINQILYSSAANTITGLATASSSTLMTDGTGVPSFQLTASNFVTSITGTANQITCSASTGAVTLSLPSSVVITTSVQAGNLQLTANTLQSVNTNGNINITPNGTGITSITNNVGIGTSTPHSALQFSNSINNRIITLYETSNNNFQYYGFGIQGNTLVYNVGEVTNLHAFYCGTSSTTSKELMRITATGVGNSGCVGINVGATPAAALHVIGGVQNVSGEDSCIRAESANSNAKIEYKCTSGSGRLYETRSSSSGTWDLVDRTGNTEKFIVNTSGFGFGGSAVAPSYDGDCNGTFRAKKLLGNSNAPSASLGGTGVVGTGATSSIVGSEIGGRFTLNTGTGVLGVGTIATFTLASVMPSNTFSIIFTPANNNASGQVANIFISSASSSTFTIANNSLLGLAASTTYIWNYQIVGY